MQTMALISISWDLSWHWSLLWPLWLFVFNLLGELWCCIASLEKVLFESLARFLVV
ncbi:hypothetical protein Peur_048593 [Populus x canadensis]